MKTLYVSDLDGTLLDGGAEISSYTKAELDRLLARGASIGFATARTPATALKIVGDIAFSVPCVLMNGSAVYDLAGKRYVKVAYIPEKTKIRLIEIIKKHGLDGFLYAVDENSPNAGGLSAFYAKADTEAAKAFIAVRERKYGKYFTRVGDIAECQDEKIVFYSISDLRGKLEPALEEFRAVFELNTEFYKDDYNKDHHYLEICAASGSKYAAVTDLRKRYGFERVVGFGDNLNDISLFKACDECYAVDNAQPELKAIATGVIASNREDGVVKKIAELVDKL